MRDIFRNNLLIYYNFESEFVGRIFCHIFSKCHKFYFQYIVEDFTNTHISFLKVKQCKCHLVEIYADTSLYNYDFEGNCIIKSFVARAGSVIFVRGALAFNCDPRLAWTLMIYRTPFL